jgi:hypothetical protein
MKWLPLCPCCGHTHWPVHVFKFYQPIVSIAPAPKVDLAALMAAIIDTKIKVGVIFSSSELKRHARIAEGPLQQLIGDLSARQLGLILADMMDRNYDGLTVRQEGKDRNGARWYVADFW